MRDSIYTRKLVLRGESGTRVPSSRSSIHPPRREHHEFAAWDLFRQQHVYTISPSNGNEAFVVTDESGCGAGSDHEERV